MVTNSNSLTPEKACITRVKGQRFSIESTFTPESFRVSPYKSLSFGTPDVSMIQQIAIVSELALRAEDFTVSGVEDFLIVPVFVSANKISYEVPRAQRIKIKWK